MVALVGNRMRRSRSLRLAAVLAFSAMTVSQCGPGTSGHTPTGPPASPSRKEVPSPTSVPSRVPTTQVVSSASPTRPPSGSSSTSTPATPAATPTLLSGRVPTLPRLGVHFITHGDRALPFVALTFDVGQTPDNPAGFDTGIVAALVEHEAPATFFLGGDWMRTHIAETRTLDGIPLFELGNHSWSHSDMRELSEAQLSAEVVRTQNMMYQITGHQTVLFRYPSGWYNDLALSVVAYHGLYSIQWDVVTADPVPDNTAENILKLVTQRVDRGSIIVMHANGRGWHTAEALPLIIEYLRGEGLCLVRISQLIGLEPPPEECQRGPTGSLRESLRDPALVVDDRDDVEVIGAMIPLAPNGTRQWAAPRFPALDREADLAGIQILHNP